MTLAAQQPSREEVIRAMRKAAEFYRNKVSTEGGYHYDYASDLSYGRSEHGEGPTQIEMQREATPIVGMSYLEAYDATGDRFFLEGARAAAMSAVRGQLCSGGWDYIVEFDPEKRKKIPYRVDNNCGVVSNAVTNLDDNVTQGVLRLMMRVDRALDFKDAAIHEATMFALDSLLKAQYPIGAWPQRFKEAPDHSKFPVKKASYPATWSREWPGPNYQEHYTFNDNTIADVIDMMLEAGRIYKDDRYTASAKKGGEFMLRAQMPEPQPAWAQQYDRDMHPAWARIFEPPSVTGGESQGVMRMLLVLYAETGDRRYIDAVGPALRYLKASILPEVTEKSETRRKFKPGEPVVARFYELKTNRPLYVTKGSRIQAAGLGSKLVDGYKLSYTDESVITHYGVLTSGAALAAIERDYQRMLKADPATLRRPDKLHGLSPWSDRAERRPRSGQAGDTAAKIQTLITSMDDRGAWTKPGTIGKADRLVFLYASKPMVLRIGRRSSDGGTGNTAVNDQSQTIQLKENDTVEVFQGPQPPLERIISSSDFADNLQALAAYVKAR